MKALVVGGDGLIGQALSASLQASGDDVIRTTRRPARPAEGWLPLDLAGPLPASVPACDVAFFCAAMTRFADCRAAPQLAARVNVSAPVELAARLVERGSRVILLSTSAVLDCREAKMRAERPYLPRGAYGAQKAAAERAFLALGLPAMVLRLTKVLTSGDARIAEWKRALRGGRAVSAFDDHRFSPIGEDDAVGALLAVARDGNGGIYQVSGRDDMSYAELAYEIARRLGVPRGLVRPCSAAAAGIPQDEITPYSSLDTSRLGELCGFVPPPASRVLDRALA